MTAAGVDELSKGRCILGLGASGPQVIEGFHGVPYDAPIGRTREIVEICRQVWAREEPVVHDGRYYQLPLPEDQGTGLGKPLKIITKPPRPNIPIHVAALGPRNVAMTAEIADGWLPILYHPDRAADVWGADLAAGEAKRDAELGTMDVIAGGLLAVGEGAEAVRDFACFSATATRTPPPRFRTCTSTVRSRRPQRRCRSRSWPKPRWPVTRVLCATRSSVTSTRA